MKILFDALNFTSNIFKCYNEASDLCPCFLLKKKLPGIKPTTEFDSRGQPVILEIMIHNLFSGDFFWGNNLQLISVGNDM